MIAQSENERVLLAVLPVTRVQFPTVTEYFKRFLPGLSHVLPCTQCREDQRAERSGAPLEKCLHSHEDHEMPANQPSLRRKKTNPAQLSIQEFKKEQEITQR